MNIWRSFFAFATIGLAIGLWVTLRVIFAKVAGLTASPFEAFVFILTPTIILGVFLATLAVNILIVPNHRLRWALYLIVGVAYVPGSWQEWGSVFAVLGIFAAQFVFERILLSELKNQIEPQLSRAVLGAGIVSLIIMAVTLSFFYYPIYSHNLTHLLLSHTDFDRLLPTITTLGYFFIIQTFTTVGTYMAAVILFVLIPLLHRAGVLKKERYHVEEWRYHR